MSPDDSVEETGFLPAEAGEEEQDADDSEDDE
jgi:hypothetical protein